MLDKKSTIRDKGIVKLFLSLFRTKLAKVGGFILLGVMALIIGGSFLAPFSPYYTSSDLYAPPTSLHVFGTDYLGHDLFSQIVWGGYPSLFVAIVGSLGSVLLGFVVGILSGYFPKLEGPLGGSSDVVMAFPAIPLLILLGSILPYSDTLLLGLLVLFLWPPLARAVRAQVASVKRLPYVDAARASGLSDWSILLRVISPEVGPIAVAYFIINASIAVVITTALEFLGVGNPDLVSWGSILYWAQQFAFISGAWWWILIPGAIITSTAIGFALIGFSVEELMNPRLRKIQV